MVTRDTFTVFVLKCLEDRDTSYSRDSFLQAQVFNKATANEVITHTHWIEEAEILALKTIPRRSIYILPRFDGDHFVRLEQLKAKIYGSDLFLRFVDASLALPHNGFPMFSTILDNAVVSFTGISAKEREENSKLIQYMGGRVCRQFDSSVTHLLADFCDPTSEKYRAARLIKVPVLASKWISDLWTEMTTNGDISETEFARLTKQNILPIFRGCVICVSGFDSRELIDIGNLIEMHGGVYSAQMCKSDCTHLIVSRTSGQKYHKAQKWGTVKIVDLKWLKRSVELAHRLPEEKFLRSGPTNHSQCNDAVAAANENDTVVEACQPNAPFQATEEPPVHQDRANVEKADKTFDTSTNLSQLLSESCASAANLEDSTDVVEQQENKENAAPAEPITKKARKVFEVVEQEAKEKEAKRNSMSRSNSSVMLGGEMRRRTSQAGTIRSGVRPSFGYTSAVSTRIILASPAKLPTEEMDSSQKSQHVMAWVEKSVQSIQQGLNQDNITQLDRKNTGGKTVERKKNISAPLGAMVINMHQQLLESKFPIKAVEFKKEILAAIDNWHMYFCEQCYSASQPLQRWYQKFRSGNTSLEDEPHDSRPSVNFLQEKCFKKQDDVKNAFNDFIASRSPDFYAIGINKLVSRWQKCIDSNGLHFD